MTRKVKPSSNHASGENLPQRKPDSSFAQKRKEINNKQNNKIQKPSILPLTASESFFKVNRLLNRYWKGLGYDVRFSGLNSRLFLISFIR